MSHTLPEISEIRSLIYDRLAPHVHHDVSRLEQSFLLNSKNEFAGVRFKFGPFTANWTVGADEVIVLRDRQTVMAIPLLTATASASEQSRAV